ncbi:MAG: RNA polymerase sigma factor SigZ [Acidobacteriota bacterium]|nr:RNA polymerase sigma factor SigZ [Acidobacteriota bacterium]
MISQTETIWNEFGQQLRAFILRRVGDKDAAADILQDVFLKIHTHIATLRNSERLRAWLYQITRNAIHDYYRRQKPQDEFSEELMAEELIVPATPETAALTELAQCVRPLLQQVPEPYREALVMSELQGLTQQEVAQRQKLSLSGAKSRVQRGREKLKKVLLDCCALDFDHRGGVVGYDACQHDCGAC